jgi:ribose-phosphate pyrophosphokinase
MRNSPLIFCGSASQWLGNRVSQRLELTPGACTVERFPDGEINVRIDQPVRGHEVFIIQSTCPPVDQNIIELLALADACRRSSAASITAVVPYFGYGRADKRNGQRAPVTGRMIATFIETIGIQHLLTVDLHAAQLEGFFQIPVDGITAVPSLAHALQSSLEEGTVVVSPDEGRVKMAADFARRLKAPLVVLHKERRSGTKTRVTNVIGTVRDRPCLIIDDMISTGGTIADAVDALLNAGARSGMLVAATHPVFCGDVRARLHHPAIRKIFVTDSIPFHSGAWPELKVISLAPLLAAAISRFRAGESIGDLFEQVIHGGLFEEVGAPATAQPA